MLAGQNVSVPRKPAYNELKNNLESTEHLKRLDQSVNTARKQ